MEPNFSFLNKKKVIVGKTKIIAKVNTQKAIVENTHMQEAASLKISFAIRKFIQRKTLMSSLTSTLKNRLNDMEKVKNMFGPSFSFPLKSIVSLIRDFHYLLVMKKGNLDISSSEIFKGLVFYIQGACENEKENLISSLLQSFFLQPGDNKEKLMTQQFSIHEYSYLAFIRISKLSFTFLKAMDFQISTPITLLKSLLSSQLYSSPKLVLSLFQNCNSLEILSNKLKKFNELIHSDKNAEKMISDLLLIATFPFDCKAFSYEENYLLLNFNSKFLLSVLSCPGYIVNHFIKLPNFDITLIPRIYKAFIYSELNGLNCNFETLKENFQLKFRKAEGMIQLLGNTVYLIDECFYKKSNMNQLQDLLLVICLIMNITSASFLNNIFNFDIAYEKEYFLLKQRIMLLFEGKLLKWFFGSVYQVLQGTDYFNLIPSLYSSVLMKAQRIENGQTLVAHLTSALILSEKQLSQIFQIFFQKESTSTLENLYNDPSMKEILYFVLYLYYNVVQIYDIDDFKQSKIFNSKLELQILIRFLVGFVSRTYMDKEQTESSINLSISKIGAKVLCYLYDFNAIESFTKSEDWLISKSHEAMVINEIVNKKLQSGTFPEIFTLVKSLPFSFNFYTRLDMLDAILKMEREASYGGTQLHIRRNAIYEDGFSAFSQLQTPELKGRIHITFVDQEGLQETGQDAGGLFKEFLNEICNIVFDPSYGLFLISTDQQLYPNPYSNQLLGDESSLETFLFIGILVARATLDNILIGKQFSPFFLRKILGKINLLNELKFLDPELHKNLKFIKNYEGNVEDMELTFSISDTINPQKEIDLRPGGSNMKVTNINRFSYVYSVANYKLNEQLKTPLKAFITGFNKVFPIEYLQIFHESELQKVISGDSNSFDVSEFYNHVKYSGYSSTDKIIKSFWACVEEMDAKDRSLLLKFVTSCERPPLMGFKHLYPPFTITPIDSQKDSSLPSASTCFNTLKLPKYSNKKILQEKLLIAIRHGTGFYLA